MLRWFLDYRSNINIRLKKYERKLNIYWSHLKCLILDVAGSLRLRDGLGPGRQFGWTYSRDQQPRVCLSALRWWGDTRRHSEPETGNEWPETTRSSGLLLWNARRRQYMASNYIVNRGIKTSICWHKLATPRMFLCWASWLDRDKNKF